MRSDGELWWIHSFPLLHDQLLGILVLEIHILCCDLMGSIGGENVWGSDYVPNWRRISRGAHATGAMMLDVGSSVIFEEQILRFLVPRYRVAWVVYVACVQTSSWV